ncbi:MAG: anaerobic ribonucleoside-triphosphate reductase [Candidatus Hermodarchaeota archaeon]
MDADKNHNLLEKQLKTLGQKIRIDILKKLKTNQTPLSFSGIQKEVLGNDLSTVNLSFHLNTLKKSELIDSSEEGYSITILGEKIIDKILSIEQILNQQNQTKMIRTSKYSKELFDTTKIEKYLVTEGELEHFLAKQIAREVEERLSKTNIEYLTAPLMREYINAVLLEKGLEEIRHKLTRLGTPPFEVTKLFESRRRQINPRIFIEKLGSDVSEQYLLLNLIPKNLADLYLSGEIALLHLNYWALRPLSLYIDTEGIMDYFYNENINLKNNGNKELNNTELVIQFTDLLYCLKQFYSEDLVLGNFNTQFLSAISLPKTDSSELLFLTSQIARFNNSFNKTKSSLTLEFNNRSSTNQHLIDEAFFLSLTKRCKGLIKPLFLFEYSNLYPSDSQNNNIQQLILSNFRNNAILYSKSISNVFNSSLIPISNFQTSQVILDKILINLHSISIEARQNDEKFLELLQEKLSSVFKLYDYKEKLVQKKLNSLKQWDFIVSSILKGNRNYILKEALKSISFFGLNEAVLHHCGIELDRTESSESFALKILTLMKQIISEKNNSNGNKFVLSQPHYDSYLEDSWHNGKPALNQTSGHYTPTLIKDDCSLSFDKKIHLFKKFQSILDRGALFTLNISENERNILKTLKNIIQCEISAISLKKNN